MADVNGSESRTPWARIVAPVVLVVALIVIVVVVQGSLAIDDDDSPDSGRAESVVSEKGAHDGAGDGAETPKTYVVEEGDTLSAIAEKFGVSTERLERLNPEIDPATLNAGTEIKIR